MAKQQDKQRGRWQRLWHHLTLSPRELHKAFPKSTLAAIERAVGESESRHRGELRFVIEQALSLVDLLQNQSSRTRAIGLFTRFGIDATEEKSGVLIYVLFADRKVELVADSGIDALIEHTVWEAISARMATAFASEQFEAGALAGINEISDLLARHFPARGDNPEELPNAPIILG